MSNDDFIIKEDEYDIKKEYIMKEKSKIVELFITEGFSLEQAYDLFNTIERCNALANYYDKYIRRRDVLEEEVKAFLIVPILFSLGWTQQQIKMEEVNKADFALMSRPFHKSQRDNSIDEDVEVVIEAKSFCHTDLSGAYKQAQSYVKDFPMCRAIAVSNGQIFKTYSKKESNFDSDYNNYDGFFDILSPFTEENIDFALKAIRCLKI